jgi:hypothetical protein
VSFYDTMRSKFSKQQTGYCAACALLIQYHCFTNL